MHYQKHLPSFGINVTSEQYLWEFETLLCYSLHVQGDFADLREAEEIFLQGSSFCRLVWTPIYQMCYFLLGKRTVLPLSLQVRLNLGPRCQFMNYIQQVSCIKFLTDVLKCGFCQKSFIMNAPLVSCPFLVITFGWMQQQIPTPK